MNASPEQIIRDFCDAWSRKNIDELMSFFAQDVFANLLMPERFAPKGEDYIDGYSFGGEQGGGPRNSCY